MINSMPDLLAEVKKIWPHCDDIRNNNGSIEFGLKALNGHMNYWPYYSAPSRVEKYIISYLKVRTVDED